MKVETPTGAVIVLSTAPNQDMAVTLARTLVEERLAACVNVVPGVRSIYSWEGAIHDDGELLLVVKTRAEKQEAVVARITELHEYDVPEAVVLPVIAGSEAYLTWLSEATS